MISRANITNILLFQLGWFACVLGGAYDEVILGSMVAIAVIGYHLYRATDTIQELRLLSIALIIGFIFESIVTAQELARYSHGQIFDAIAPLWIVLMWPLFATTLNLSMRWMKAIAPILVALIGAVFAPLAYYAGNRLGAVEYDHFNLSIGLIAIAWAALLPAMVTMSMRLDGYTSSPADTDARDYAHHV